MGAKWFTSCVRAGWFGDVSTRVSTGARVNIRYLVSTGIHSSNARPERQRFPSSVLCHVSHVSYEGKNTRLQV